MTNMSFEEAVQTCAAEVGPATEARNDWLEARQEYQDALDQLEAETSFWDESTYGTAGSGVALVGGVITCFLPELASKVICGSIIFGSGLAGAGSEVDRRREINQAKAAVERARAKLDRARARADKLVEAANSCVRHHQISVTPL